MYAFVWLQVPDRSILQGESMPEWWTVYRRSWRTHLWVWARIQRRKVFCFYHPYGNSTSPSMSDRAFLSFRCMIDVDECVDRPCFNDGRCVNTYGYFNCYCLVGFSGRLCEINTEVRNQLVSSSWNSWIGELVAMLAFLTAIFVLTLFFLIVWKGTCKPDESNKVLDKYKDVDSYIQRSSVYNQARKESHTDTPPQVPVRPISYTPIIPGECRNNQGSVPEFSSFTPDSLFGFRKTVAVCSVAPNLPHLKAFHSHSENDSIEQMDWDEEYDGKCNLNP